MGILDHLSCLLRNLYAGQGARVRTRHGKTDWFQIGKGVCQGCILSPCLFKLYVEYIMRNAGLDEAQTGIMIAGRNINNLRYVDDTYRVLPYGIRLLGIPLGSSPSRPLSWVPMGLKYRSRMAQKSGCAVQ